jgi:hypothetical protein
MKPLVVLGAGRSSTYFLSLLNVLANENPEIEVKVFEQAVNVRHLQQPRFPYLHWPEESGLEYLKHGGPASLVVSLLPVSFHREVLSYCIANASDMLTASYITDELRNQEVAIAKAGIRVLMEFGLDPGWDHASALVHLHDLKEHGATLLSFESHTGGLIEPLPGDPWQYRITWNPGNVVRAGLGGAQWREDGAIQTQPYETLFKYPIPIQIEEEAFEAYPNRDSLHFMAALGITGIETFIRGTLRYPGFCEAWHQLIQWNLTSTEDTLPEGLQTISDWTKFKTGMDAKAFAQWLELQNEALKERIAFLNLYSVEPLLPSARHSADVLESILIKRWALAPDIKDRVVMVHRIRYQMGAHIFQDEISLDFLGEAEYSAMAKGVGSGLWEGLRIWFNADLTPGSFYTPLHYACAELMMAHAEEHQLHFTMRSGWQADA